MKKKYMVECEIAEFKSAGTATTNNIRMISWYGGDPKVDIGKWINIGDENEYRKSGLALTVAETNSMTETLVREGFGERDAILQALKDRKVERVGEVKATVKTVPSDEEEDKVDFYDPKEALV